MMTATTTSKHTDSFTGARVVVVSEVNGHREAHFASDFFFDYTARAKVFASDVQFRGWEKAIENIPASDF